MAHFTVFYKCVDCKKPMMGAVQDTVRILHGAVPGKCHSVVLSKLTLGPNSEVKMWCSECAIKSQSLYRNTDLVCEGCQNNFGLFYSPALILVQVDGLWKPVDTESLLMLGHKYVFCSVKCWHTAVPKFKGKEPFFVDFNKPIYCPD